MIALMLPLLFLGPWLLTRVIPGDGRSVTAVTSLGNQLYVIRGKSEGQVEVYEAENCTFQRNIRVEELGDWVTGLTSCEFNSCLYISDFYNEVIHRVDLFSDSKASFSWKVDGVPRAWLVHYSQQQPARHSP